VKDAVAAKLRHGAPLHLSAEETAYLVEILRSAMAATLEVPSAEIGDDARVFADLGLDSIDVFDVLDQLTERFEVPLTLEQMPESMLKGDPDVTFRAFAEALLRHLGGAAR